jgi:hypothetical protein
MATNSSILTNKLHAQYMIIQEALISAREACDKMISENPGQWYPCGFSSVRIKPARGKIVQALKELNFGRTDDYLGGFVVSNPARNCTQWMDAKMAGSVAFVEVLAKYGIKAQAESRID